MPTYAGVYENVLAIEKRICVIMQKFLTIMHDKNIELVDNGAFLTLMNITPNPISLPGEADISPSQFAM